MGWSPERTARPQAQPLGGESSSIGDWWLDGNVTGLALNLAAASVSLDGAAFSAAIAAAALSCAITAAIRSYDQICKLDGMPSVALAI